jgi:hypothetical protein
VFVSGVKDVAVVIKNSGRLMSMDALMMRAPGLDVESAIGTKWRPSGLGLEDDGAPWLRDLTFRHSLFTRRQESQRQRQRAENLREA